MTCYYFRFVRTCTPAQAVKHIPDVNGAKKNKEQRNTAL